MSGGDESNISNVLRKKLQLANYEMILCSGLPTYNPVTMRKPDFKSLFSSTENCRRME